MNLSILKGEKDKKDQIDISNKGRKIMEWWEKNQIIEFMNKNKGARQRKTIIEVKARSIKIVV